MATPLVEIEPRSEARSFDVRTTHSDTYRASLRASGPLDAASAPLLAEVITGHVRSRRRFIRLDVGALRVADEAGARVLAEMHRRLLAARGTLILTGVLPSFESALSRAGIAGELFTLPPAAFEAPRPTPTPA